MLHSLFKLNKNCIKSSISNEIGIIFITKDGHTLYGIVNKKLQDFKYPIGHTSIFDACIKELGIDLPPGLDQMDYAWSLALSDIDIISIQITLKELIIVMNKDSNDNQLSLLTSITKCFDKYDYLFTADVCYDENKHESIFNQSSKCEVGLELEEFNRQLNSILSNLNRNRVQK